MGFRIYCLKNFEDFWVGMNGVNQQVLQKVNFGSHLKDWSQGDSWESPGERQ